MEMIDEIEVYRHEELHEQHSQPIRQLIVWLDEHEETLVHDRVIEILEQHDEILILVMFQRIDQHDEQVETHLHEGIDETREHDEQAQDDQTTIKY